MSDYTRGLQDALNLAKFAFIGADNNPEREPATQYVYSVDLVEAIENLLEPSGQEVVRYAAEAALRAETPASREPQRWANTGPNGEMCKEPQGEFVLWRDVKRQVEPSSPFDMLRAAGEPGQAK